MKSAVLEWHMAHSTDGSSQVDRHLVVIGRAFLRARRAHQLSQRGLAALSGVPQSTISRLETGRRPSIRVVHLARLVAVVGRVTIDVDGAREPKPIPAVG